MTCAKRTIYGCHGENVAQVVEEPEVGYNTKDEPPVAYEGAAESQEPAVADPGSQRPEQRCQF